MIISRIILNERFISTSISGIASIFLAKVDRYNRTTNYALFIYLFIQVLRPYAALRL